MLMQDEATEFWKTEPFTIPSIQDFRELNSYTTVITMGWDDAAGAMDRSLRFASSVQNNFMVNGQLLLVGPDGADVKADDSGRITIILPVDDLGAPMYTLTLPGGLSRIVNPMDGVNAKLGNLKTGNDLANAKVEDENGNKTTAFSGGQGALDDAAKALQMLREREADIRSGKAVAATPEAPPEEAKPRGWAFFKWIASQVKKAAEWVVKKVGEAVHFVITLAGKVVSFVVNTVTQVAKAISSVLETIGAGINKLLKLLGDFFKPADYIDMQRLLCNAANHGLHWAWSSIDTASAAVDEQLLRLAVDISKIDVQHLPEFMHRVKIHPKKFGGGSIANVLKVINSPLGRWGQSALDNGGAANSSGEVGAILNNFLTHAVRVMKDVEDMVLGIKNEIAGLLDQDEFSIADLVAKLGKKFAVGILQVLKSVIHLILRLFSDIAAKIAIELNKPRDIPILSALFKLQFKKDLTVLDAVMFVLAIPVTLVFKIFSGGKSLKDLPGLSEFLAPDAAWTKLKSTWTEGERTRKWSAINSLPANGEITPLLERGTLSASQSSSAGGEGGEERAFKRIKTFFENEASYIVPTIAIIWFNMKTKPGILKSGSNGFGGFAVPRFLVSGLLWVVTLPLNVENRDERTHRIVVHSIGAIRPFGSFVQTDVDGLFGARSASAQLWGLVSVIVATCKREGNYDAELAIKEVLSVLATQSTGVGKIIAKDPASKAAAVVAASVTNNVSNIYQIVAAGVHMKEIASRRKRTSCVPPL